MRLPVPLLLSCVALASLAPVARAGAPAVCNAKHKRQANLYGSVLADGLNPTLASSAPGGPAKAEPVPPITTGSAPVVAKPVQVSRADLRASFEPCGRGRA